MNPVKVVINRDFDLYRQRAWERTENEARWQRIWTRAVWACTLVGGAVLAYFLTH